MSSLPLHDDALWGFVCLALPRALLVWRLLPSRASRSHPNCGGVRAPSPSGRPHGRGGPRCPSCSSAARYARTARRCGRLWHSGTSLRLGVFVGWRSAAQMAVVAIAPWRLQRSGSCWGRSLCILLARACCWALSTIALGSWHQLAGRSLNGAWLLPPLCFRAGLSTTARGGLLCGRASPFSRLADRGCRRASVPWPLACL